MVIEREYLEDVLRKSGVRSRIHETIKTMESSGEIQICGIVQNGDELERSGQTKRYMKDQARHKRTRLWDRKTKMKVIIGEASAEKCEKIFTEFLRNLDKGIYIDGNWTGIEVGQAEWISEKDSILRSRMAVEFQVAFAGGIFKDTDFLAADEVSAEIREGML